MMKLAADKLNKRNSMMSMTDKMLAEAREKVYLIYKFY